MDDGYTFEIVDDAIRGRSVGVALNGIHIANEYGRRDLQKVSERLERRRGHGAAFKVARELLMLPKAAWDAEAAKAAALTRQRADAACRALAEGLPPPPASYGIGGLEAGAIADETET